MSLPPRWVDRIFARMLVRYGAAWIRLWEGVDPDALKVDWAEHLARVSATQLLHGLENLPADRPPTVAQFRFLCVAMREQSAPMFLAPARDPERVKAIVAAVDRTPADPLANARRLRAREEAGERLTLAQREFWRAALRREMAGERADQEQPA